jgi:uncharacterized protein
MKYLTYKYIITFLLLLVAIVSNAKEVPPRPASAVADFKGLLDLAQKSALEAKLKTFNDTSSMAIVVAIDGSTEDEAIFDYSYKIAKSWGIGNKEKDNGVLLYIAFDDRKMYIQVGSGMEGVIPDAMAKRIIENVLSPSFRSGDFYGGIDKAVDVMIQLASGEYTADATEANDNGIIIVFFLLFGLVFIIIISIAVYRCKKRGDCNDGGGYYGGGTYNSGGGWIFGSGGGFGSGSSGGGFGGGSFGGFGGGGFSGGGAGGGW